MLLVLVSILVVLVAQEDASSLGAPTPIRLFHTVASAHNHTDTVPAQEETGRKVSVEVPHKIFTEEENKAAAPTSRLDNQSHYRRAIKNTNAITTTQRSETTVYDFQLDPDTTGTTGTTAHQRSLEELLNLARIKYLGQDLRKQSPFKTVNQRKPTPTAKVINRRIPILNTSKQLRDLLPPMLRSSRLSLADPSPAQTLEFISMKNVNSSLTTPVPTSRQTEEGEEMEMAGDIISDSDMDNKRNLYTATHRNYWGSSTLVKSLPGKIEQKDIPDQSSKMSDIVHLMSVDETDSLVKSLHQGRSLMHHLGPMLTNIQSTQESLKANFIRPAIAPNDALNKKEFVSGSAQGEGNLIKSEVKDTEDDTYTEDDTDTVDVTVDNKAIYDGQYHEINPGQYHEVNPGQYHEENPGQYHEENPGQYHEEFPGQYHEYNPGQYQEISSGQEVQLDIEFNPEDETKTYNVHKKTGEYIIGEVGKIDINNGQTLEGVRYTAVDSMVDQAQIAEILQRYFGTKTT